MAKELLAKKYMSIHPAGYPINYRSSIDALRVDVIAGGSVAIEIPLVASYIYTGVVADKQGKPVAGATVEATSIKTKTKPKLTSVTNDAGVYYLEGLEQGEYKLTVSDLPASPDKLILTPKSQPTQELNITVDIPSEIPTPAADPTPSPTPTPPAPTTTPPKTPSKIGRNVNIIHSPNINHSIQIGQAFYM
jgi:hypothetical protein